MPPRVLIIQSHMKQYRVSFFLKLYEYLQEAGVELIAAYSAPSPQNSLRGDNWTVPSTFGKVVKARWFFSEKLIYQSVFRLIPKADLVIIYNENKFMINPFLLLLSRLRLKKVAYWGHGYNRKVTSRFSEWFRVKTLSLADWWFSYTPGVTAYLQDHGVRQEIITTVNNSIDTSALRADLEDITPDMVESERAELQIPEGSRIGIFCGSLYKNKRLPFLIEAAVMIKQKVPNFHLIISGWGPDGELVSQLAQKHSWIHVIGPVFGKRKATLLKMSDAFLLPGLVGLAIIDAFAAGLPFMTTEFYAHSPEIDYLVPGENGSIAADDLTAYVESVVSVLSNRELWQRLHEGSLASAKKYTTEAMARNYADGILKCLNITPP
jgi:glycosyltransferase involved in cell wall biosynthesis